jgi:hypothetical protein
VSAGSRIAATRLGAALAALLAVAPAPASIVVDASDPRCISLPSAFPPGLDWIDPAAGLAVVTSFSPAVAAPVDFGARPPAPAAPGPFADLRSAIAAAACGGSRDPQLDGVTVVDPGLALLTGSSCESVAFADPATGALRSAAVSTPVEIPPGVFPHLPAPGAGAARVALSTRMCVEVQPGAQDSRGETVPNGCRPGAPSYYTSFTSGAAVAAGRLFVATSNLGAGAGTLAPQFLPGTVLVYDFAGDPLAASPHPTTPALLTTAFNPTHVTAYTTPSGRPLVLVGASGPIGLVADDPRTPFREAGGAALGDAAIDVIDAEQLRLVATIPLGPAALAFERLGIDPGGRIALIGSAIARRVYAVDLAPLDALPPTAPFVRLDGVEGPRAALFDADRPLVLPALPNGAPPATCPGFVVGVEFGSAGRAFATDFCDGTITELAVPTRTPWTIPLPPAAFRVRATIPVVAPVGPASLGRAQAAGPLRVRTAADGPDEVAVLVGQPEGLACAIRVPTPEPAAPGIAAGVALTFLATRRRRRHDPRAGGGRRCRTGGSGWGRRRCAPRSRSRPTRRGRW